MKPCPYCAEEVQDAAIKCRHCQASIPQVTEATERKAESSSTPPQDSPKPTFSASDKKAFGYIWKGFLVLILVACSFVIWWITFPILAIWFLRTRTKLDRKKKRHLTLGLVLFSLTVQAVIFSRVPSLTLIEPIGATTTQTDTFTIKGRVTPPTAVAVVGEKTVTPDKEGNFSYELSLQKGRNEIEIFAKRDGYTGSAKKIVIQRDLTIPEFTEALKKQAAEDQAKAEAQAAKDRAEAEARAKEEAKAKAEQATYEKSKPGQICKRHPEWTKEDCERIADNRYWVGMSYDMLVYMRGKPNSINPSNYGRETQYQYCWYDYTPSCFYDQNGDDLLDAFN